MDMSPLPDPDPQETQEWLDALDGVLEYEGTQRAHYLLEKLIDKARRSGAYLPYSANTAYINTIPPGQEERSPGNHELEHRIRSYVRWNAMAMVVRANKISSELGGHIAGHLRTCLSGRPHHRGATRQLPSGSRRQGLAVLSASMADAELLAIPDR